MRFYIITLLICTLHVANAQKTCSHDSIKKIKEVVLNRTLKNQSAKSMLKNTTCVEDVLATNTAISFIKRGAFGWEPLLNNMGTERAVITIDGMHLFGACTDKMDPVTSYLENNSLSNIEINSGQQGSGYGATIGGNINLIKKQSAFTEKQKYSGDVQTKLETNNTLCYNAASVSVTNPFVAIDAFITHKKAANYHDGLNKEILHSQYTKLNTGIGCAFKTGENANLKMDASFDLAKNVGFPALPMDLWLSRALITSSTYTHLFNNKAIKSWETKLYYNAIEHYMDDTTRPENKVHMDMPGWSTTYGALTKIKIQKTKFTTQLIANWYNNTSIAEMRMYPQDRSKRSMFAYTWPWIITNYFNISTNITWKINEQKLINLTSAISNHYNFSKYVEFNKIFHPNAAQNKTRILPNFAFIYQYNTSTFYSALGIGYGHRAPSVSEGYGYYIYNSFDRYDYIGNPSLKSEIAYETNAKIGYRNKNFGTELKANSFYIQNYIVGQIITIGSPMNYQSIGVKKYNSLDFVTLFNTSLNTYFNLTKDLKLTSTVTFARAIDHKKTNLPFIKPFSYQTNLWYNKAGFEAIVTLQGDATQIHYSPTYGEDKTPAYHTWNATVNYNLPIKKYTLKIQTGVENFMNKQYSTYADWGNIPRMGRNIMLASKINF